MADELVEQLKGRAQFLRDKGRIKSPELMEEAAARIQSDAAEIARLRAEVEALKQSTP